MSQRAESHAVQLFPFLAVLVCTMGALIFLLLVTAQQVRQRAINYAKFQQHQRKLAAAASAKPASLPILSIPIPKPVDPEPASEPIPIPKPILRRVKPPKTDRAEYEAALAERERENAELKSDWERKSSQLEAARQKLAAVLASQQSAVDESLESTTTLESAVAALESQITELARTVEAGTNKPEDEAELLTLEKQIREAKQRLRAAQMQDASHQEPHFQVVPFDPQSGTTRRPILIECTESGMRFLPEGITVTPSDLAGFTSRVNPIAVGTGALINYWNNKRMQHGKFGDNAEPYVLLVVRPNGVIGYYVAIKMLEPIKTAHGYELIEDSTVLHLPDVDPEAKAACEAAIKRVMAERDNIFKAAMNSGAGASVFGGNAYQPGSGPSRGPNGGGTGGRAGGGSGAGGGFVSGKVEHAVGTSTDTFNLTDISGNDGPVGTRSWERIENFQGRPRNRKGGEGLASSEGNTDGSYGGSAQATSRPSSSSNSSSSGNTFGEQIAPFDEASEGEEQAEASTKGGRRRTSKSNGSTSNASDTEGEGFEESGESGEQGDGSSSGSRLPRANQPRLPRNNVDKPGNLDDLVEHDRNMPVGRRPGRNGNSATGALNGSVETSSKKSGSGDGDNESSSEGDSESDSDSGGGSSGSQSSSGIRTPFSLQKNLRAKKPPKKLDDNKDTKFEPEMLKGRHWGFSDQGASIGFEREVRVDVHQDKLVLAEKYEIPLGEVDSKQEVFEQFVSILDKHSREWGRPPTGFFWAPRVKFIVKADAYSRYEMVNDLMTRSGVSTSQELLNASGTRVEYGRDTPPPKQITTPAPPTKKPRRFSAGGMR